MKYTITGSTGHISKPLSALLIQAGHQVTLISSDRGKMNEIERLGARALIGSVDDVGFITNAFAGADAVYTMVPPKLDALNWKAFVDQVGQNYQQAIQTTGVKKVVNLSAMGAHLSEGGGLVSLYNGVEQTLNELVGVDIVHLRPGSFYTNFLGNIGMIKHGGILGSNYGDVVVPLAHPADIAQAAFAELTGLGFTGKTVRYVVSDEQSTDQIARVLGEAIGKPDLRWVRFSDEDALNGMLKGGLSEDVARNLVEMGQALASGKTVADYLTHKPALSPTKLASFAREFASVYATS